MTEHLQGLPDGFRIEDYELQGVLSSSDVGIKYLGRECSSDRRVAIQELLPAGVGIRESDGRVVPQSSSAGAVFQALVEQFLREARALETFQHPNIVGVQRVLEANGTAYVVLDYVEGEALSSMLERSPTLNHDQFEAIMQPVSDCLEAMHGAGLLHQDIRPSNIVVGADGTPVLLAIGAAAQEFAAARQAFADRSSSRRAIRSPTVYAPLEMYSLRAKRGPWTDVYALGATMYEAITGHVPPAAPGRIIEESIAPLQEFDAPGFRKEALAGIGAALGLRPEDRPRSISAWRSLYSDAPEAGVGARTAGRFARMSARGARLPRAQGADEAAASHGRPRWAVPAISLTAATIAVAYLDVGLLRTEVDAPQDGPAITQSPIARSTLQSSRNRSPEAPPASQTAPLPEASTSLPVAEAEPEPMPPRAGEPALAASDEPAPVIEEPATAIPEEPEAGSEELAQATLEEPAAASEISDLAALDESASASEIPDLAALDESVAPSEGPDLAMLEEGAPAAEEAVAAETDPPAAAGATLNVTTQPMQVEVLVAGAFVGRTPLTLEDQPAGTYEVTLRHPFYETVVISDQLLEPGAESRIERIMARASGRLMVTTEPVGAWVSWNGERLLDSTPGLLRDLPAGPIQLQIGAAGRRTEAVFAEVPKNATGYVTRALRMAYGTLTVATEPEDATVAFAAAADGGGEYRPGMRVRQGSYVVEVSRDGYRNASVAIEVDGDTRIEVELEPQQDSS